MRRETPKLQDDRTSSGTKSLECLASLTLPVHSANELTTGRTTRDPSPISRAPMPLHQGPQKQVSRLGDIQRRTETETIRHLTGSLGPLCLILLRLSLECDASLDTKRHESDLKRQSSKTRRLRERGSGVARRLPRAEGESESDFEFLHPDSNRDQWESN